MKTNLVAGSKDFLKLVKQIWENTFLLYEDLKIKNKLFILNFIIIFIICAISLLALQRALSIYDELLYNEAAQVLNLSTSAIENEIKRIDKLSYNIISDSKVQGYIEIIKNSDSTYERSDSWKELITVLALYSTSEKNISSIHFVDTLGNQIGNGAEALNIKEEEKNYIVDNAAKKGGGYVLLEPTENDKSLVVARSILAVPGLSLQNMGTLIIRYNVNKLIQQHITTSSPKNSSMLVVFSGKKLIYASQGLEEIKSSELEFDTNHGYSITMINGKKFFVAHIASDYIGWNYISIIPYERIFQKIIFLRNIIIFIFLVIFLLSVFVSMRFARNMTKPLENLTFKMKRIENGDFRIEENEAKESFRQDEIGHLQKDFQIMIKKIDTLIKDDFIKQIVIKDAQLKALQAQINPHFLYNTLESINWMAKVNKQNNISLMVESLGNLMRSAISSKEKVITIKEEIRLLESYITIQKIRYEDRLCFQLEMDDHLMNYAIPRLSLQPIVENSINYGLENMISTCRIQVKAIEKPEFLEIVINDNGPGIEANTLELLRTGEVRPKGLGIGLKNIDDRIKLIFGEQYGIIIDSQIGVGTWVRIHIPYETRNVNV